MEGGRRLIAGRAAEMDEFTWAMFVRASGGATKQAHHVGVRLARTKRAWPAAARWSGGRCWRDARTWAGQPSAAPL